MQLLSRYLVKNRIDIIADVAGFVTEYRPVYKRQVQVYKGIDNILEFRLLNADQKPINTEGYTPKFNGIENFDGEIVHPQDWSEKINYNDKKVVIIGSGATAVTLVPELAKKARTVTMLQRSPTYIVAYPDQDKIANALKVLLPSKVSYALTRFRNVLFQQILYTLCRKYPKRLKKYATKHLNNSFVIIHFFNHYHFINYLEYFFFFQNIERK